MSSALARRRARSQPSMCLRPGFDGGIQRLLETPLTINGLAPGPLGAWIGYDGGGAASWVSRAPAEAPVTLTKTGAGAAPTLGASPLCGALDPPTVFSSATGANYVGPTNFANPGLRDIVIEALVYRASMSGAIAFKTITSETEYGWKVAHNVSGFWLALLGATNVNCFIGSTALSVWTHLIWFADRSGSMIGYGNGVAGTAQDISASVATDMTNNRAFSLGGNYAQTGGTIGGVAYFAVHMLAGWLDTHLQPTIAAQRAQLLFGTSPQRYWGSPIPTAAGSTSPSHQTKVEADGTSRIYQIGGGSVQRFRRIVDLAGRALVGVLNEGAVQNVCLQSSTLGSWTSLTRLSVSTTSTTCIDGIARTTVMLKEDNTAGNTHYVQGTASISNSTQYVFSCFAKPVNRTWIVLQANGKNVYFQLTGSGTVGTASSATGGIQSWGGGWYRCWIVFTSTSTTGAPTIYIAEADGDVTFDGGDQDSVAVSHCQLKLGNFPSMPVETTTAAATKLADSFILSAAYNVGLPEGGARFLFWAPAGWTPATRRTLLSINSGGAADRIEVFIHTDGTLCAESRKTGGNDGDVAIAGSVCDGYIHEALLCWSARGLELRRDVTGYAIDATADIIASATQISVGQDQAAATNAGPAVVGELKPYPRYQPSFIEQGGGFLYGAM